MTLIIRPAQPVDSRAQSETGMSYSVVDVHMV